MFNFIRVRYLSDVMYSADSFLLKVQLAVRSSVIIVPKCLPTGEKINTPPGPVANNTLWNAFIPSANPPDRKTLHRRTRVHWLNSRLPKHQKPSIDFG